MPGGENGSNGGSNGGNGGQAQSDVPYLFGSAPYTYTRDYFDSEDVIAALSLPAFNLLQGQSFSAKTALQGFINQIASRNATQLLLPAGVNPVTKHSLKCLVAGAMLPVEDYMLGQEQRVLHAQAGARHLLQSGLEHHRAPDWRYVAGLHLEINTDSEESHAWPGKCCGR